MSETARKLVIVGAGGAGVEALWVARRMNSAAGPPVWDAIGFADDNPSLSGRTIAGLPVLGTPARIIQDAGLKAFFYCAIGNNRQRQRQAEFWEAAGWQGATLIDPTAVVAPSAEIGAGSYIAPLAFIGPEVVLGRHALINTGASVGHHTVAGDFTQLCPGGRLSGHTRLGEGAFVGSNAVTVPGATVGEWATVAAASLVVRDVPPRVTAIGVPAKILAPASPTV